MPREARPKLINGKVMSVPRGAKLLAQSLRTYSRTPVTHNMLDTTEDVSLECEVIDLTDGIKDESSEEGILREKYDQGPIVSEEYVDLRITGGAETYEDEQSGFSPLYSEQKMPREVRRKPINREVSRRNPRRSVPQIFQGYSSDHMLDKIDVSLDCEIIDQPDGLKNNLSEEGMPREKYDQGLIVPDKLRITGGAETYEDEQPGFSQIYPQQEMPVEDHFQRINSINRTVTSPPREAQILRTYSRTAVTHPMLDTTADVSLDCEIIDQTDAIKNESPEECMSREIVLDEYVDSGITGEAEIYQDEQSGFLPSYPEQVSSDVTYLNYQDVGEHRLYAPTKYIQVGNVVVQLLEAEYMQSTIQHVSGGDIQKSTQRISKTGKKVAKKKMKQSAVELSDPVRAHHWADVYVEEEGKTAPQEESDASKKYRAKIVPQEESEASKKFIIGQDDNEVNVHIITKDGKETTTIINTFREVEQRPSDTGTHGGNKNCRCKICEEKNKSYVDAFQQFLSQMKVVQGPCSEPPSKKVKTENPCKTENPLSY